MPGFVTHYLFGVDAYRALPSGNFKHNLKVNHSAFSLGLQGPDVFFYYLPSYFMHESNIGALIHDHKTGAFFSYLLEGRELFTDNPKELGIADAYITGFIGHYSLDCTTHPYVYAFTGYTPKNPPSNSEYFGQHAYFETELDNELLYRKKHIYPTRFHQNATIFLTPLQRKVIGELLTYAYRNAFPEVRVTQHQVRSATGWMKLGTRLVRDPSGQKKVMVRLVEKLLFHRAFISPMLPSDHYVFVPDPLNLSHRNWTHPWTGETSRASFHELYQDAEQLYRKRIIAYQKAIQNGFSFADRAALTKEHGNRSFLSGQKL